MSVKTLFTLTELFKIDGHADFVRARRFDELEDGEARRSYRAASARARQAFGAEMTLTTDGGNDVTGVVRRTVVELLQCKTDGTRVWGGKVVDQNDESGDEGMRLVLEEKKTAPVAPEAVSEPANT